ncbi:MAG: hypothetical protein QOE90_1425 [Thermoplasmata archaeon]|nr:hypothetical protein [Thermoplasmata archaeon]
MNAVADAPAKPLVVKGRKKRSPYSTALVFLSFGLIIFLILPAGQAFRLWVGGKVGVVLEPVIGFHDAYPIFTILIASLILVAATTAVRHFLIDWVNMARTQEAMRNFQKEFSQARKDNNTYKIKKLTDAQPEIMEMQAEMSTENMKPMAFTMLIVVPIFAWLYLWIPVVAAAGHSVIKVPWDQMWDLTLRTDPPDNHFYFLGFLPRWIVLYSLFGIPLGQIAQRALKLWEYRHHKLGKGELVFQEKA